MCSEQYQSVDIFALTAFQFFGAAEEYDVSTIKKMVGTYVAYRPHFLDNNNLMVMTLECGSKIHASVFSLKMRYKSQLGIYVTENVEGSIIPYDGNALFLGKIEGTGAPFIFIMSRLSKSNGVIAHAQGAVIVGSSGSLPTASAMLIVRNEAPPEPRLLLRSEAEALPNWNHINQVLSRGSVSWAS